MSGPIEALYIFDEHKYVPQRSEIHKLTSPSSPILTHIYTSRPLTATQLLPLYLAHPQPRPALIYLPNTSPATLVFSLEHANLLILLTSSSELEPLLALEFLHRVIDVLEEFVGSPLLSSKIENSYEVVAQLLNEMCDAGAVSTTEPNALRDLVEVEGWVGKLLSGISIPGYVCDSHTWAMQLIKTVASLGLVLHRALTWQPYLLLAHWQQAHQLYHGGGQM